jgi:uncharacterized peroxidase-related enzyme
MPHVDPLPLNESAENEILNATRNRLGFLANSFRVMARRPGLLESFDQLAKVINGPTSSVSAELRNLIAQVASRTTGCGYSIAHAAYTSRFAGVTEAKEDELWDYEISRMYSEAERVALRVAEHASMVPNRVTDKDIAQLKQHYSEEQIIDIVSVIAMFGFLNRFNDTLATELEPAPREAGARYLEKRGWEPGKHSMR